MKTVVVTNSIGFFSHIELVASGSALAESDIMITISNNYCVKVNLIQKKERKNEGRKQVAKKERVREAAKKITVFF